MVSNRRRWRIWWLMLITIVVLTMLAGLWIRSKSHVDGVIYKYGHEAPPVNAFADPNVSLDGCLRYEARSVRLVSHDSALQLAVTGYTSYAPQREMLGSWSDWPGWETLSLASRPGTNAGDAVYYRGLLDWRLWTLGVMRTAQQGETAQVFMAPYGLLMFLFALPALVAWGRGRRRAARRWRGLCERCGYDCRGLERCPECGQALAADGSDTQSPTI